MPIVQKSRSINGIRALMNNFPCIKASASETKRNKIKHVDRIEITAPVVVGWVKSFGS